MYFEIRDISVSDQNTDKRVFSKSSSSKQVMTLCLNIPRDIILPMLNCFCTILIECQHTTTKLFNAGNGKSTVALVSII